MTPCACVCARACVCVRVPVRVRACACVGVCGNSPSLSSPESNRRLHYEEDDTFSRDNISSSCILRVYYSYL